MNSFMKDFWQGYKDLFTLWPLKIETDSIPNHVKDAAALAGDWEQIGSYMNMAIIEWDKQREDSVHK